MKNIVIFYPSFERGTTKVLINLIKFFQKKKKGFSNIQ